MSNVFLKLIGSRVINYMGLKMDEGLEPLKTEKVTDYSHLDIPFALGQELEVKRNQHIFIEAGATINVKGREVVGVEPNPALAEFGQVQGYYRVWPDSGEVRLGFWFTAHKQVSLDQFKYCVRLYTYG